MVGGYFEKKPMTNKIKKFLYTLEHLIPDGYDEIPTFALYHRLLTLLFNVYIKVSVFQKIIILTIYDRFGNGFP